MKAYVLTTGSLFGLIGLLHASQIVLHWQRILSDGEFAAENLILTAIAAGLAVWAFRLVRSAH
jgi:hypothetical protein